MFGPAKGESSRDKPEAGKDNNTPHGPSRLGRDWVHLSGTREGGPALFYRKASAMENENENLGSLEDTIREFLDEFGLDTRVMMNFAVADRQEQEKLVTSLGKNLTLFRILRKQGDHPLVALRKVLRLSEA